MNVNFDQKDFDRSLYEGTYKTVDDPNKQDFLQSVMESHYGETSERLSVLKP